MSTVTTVAIAIAVLMLAFFFVDGTSSRQVRNKTVMKVQAVILILAVVVALVSYIIGGM